MQRTVGLTSSQAKVRISHLFASISDSVTQTPGWTAVHSKPFSISPVTFYDLASGIPKQTLKVKVVIL